MKKEYNQKETQNDDHQVNEPAVVYCVEVNALNAGITSDNKTIPMKTDEFGRIVLTEEMRDAVSKAEYSLAEGTCLTEDMFQTRFEKWL